MLSECLRAELVPCGDRRDRRVPRVRRDQHHPHDAMGRARLGRAGAARDVRRPSATGGATSLPSASPRRSSRRSAPTGPSRRSRRRPSCYRRCRGSPRACCGGSRGSTRRRLGKLGSSEGLRRRGAKRNPHAAQTPPPATRRQASRHQARVRAPRPERAYRCCAGSTPTRSSSCSSGPVAEALRGRTAAHGPVSIVPAPYRRNLERLARALDGAHATIRIDGAGIDGGTDTTPTKLTRREARARAAVDAALRLPRPRHRGDRRGRARIPGAARTRRLGSSRSPRSRSRSRAPRTSSSTRTSAAPASCPRS